MPFRDEHELHVARDELSAHALSHNLNWIYSKMLSTHALISNPSRTHTPQALSSQTLSSKLAANSVIKTAYHSLCSAGSGPNLLGRTWWRRRWSRRRKDPVTSFDPDPDPDPVSIAVPVVPAVINQRETNARLTREL